MMPLHRIAFEFNEILSVRAPRRRFKIRATGVLIANNSKGPQGFDQQIGLGRSLLADGRRKV